MLNTIDVSTATPPAHRRIRGVMIATLLAAMALDVGARGGATNLFVTSGIIAIVVVVLIDGGTTSAVARALLAGAVVLALMLSWRASPWLAVSNIAACAALVTGAMLYGRGGSIFDTSLGRLSQRLWIATFAAIEGWIIVIPAANALRRRGRGRTLRIVRASCITVPFVVVTLLLLASSDAVLGAFLTPNIDLSAGVGHLLVIAIVATAVVGLGAAARADLTDRARSGAFGALEVLTMLTLATLVLLLFVAAQLVAMTGAGERLVRQSGMTPSEYARSGFFQLCWATLVIVTLLALIRRLAALATMHHAAVRTLGVLVPILTLGLVVVSLRRMKLYDDAFGLTMLRLWVVGAATWMGSVLVMMAARNLGLGSKRS